VLSHISALNCLRLTPLKEQVEKKLEVAQLVDLKQHQSNDLVHLFRELLHETNSLQNNVATLMHVGEFAYNEKVVGTPDFTIRPEYGGNIDLNRNVHSVFTQYNKSGDRWSYHAGLRLEHTDRQLEEAGGTTYSFNQWYLFPSLNVM